MARSFNGTTDSGAATPGLTLNQTALSVSMWAKLTNTATQRVWLLWGDFATNSGFIIETLAGGPAVIGLRTTGAGLWSDSFPTPSLGVWHHYLVTFNYGSPQNLVWVDGVAQTLTARTHTATSSQVANQNITVGNNGAGAGMLGSLAEVTIWFGVLLGQTFATSLATGANSVSVHPEVLCFYPPLLGNSPESDYSSGQHSVTLTGTTVVPHPGIQTVDTATS